MSLKSFILEHFISEERLRTIFTKKVPDWSSQHRVESGHFRSEVKRIKKGERRRVAYFHQTNDPYSQLTAQVLTQLIAHYDVDFVPHLVGSQDSKMIAAGKFDDYVKHCRQDTINIVTFYGL